MASSTDRASIRSNASSTSRLASKRGQPHPWALRNARRTQSAMSSPGFPGTKPSCCGAIGCMLQAEVQRRRAYNLKRVAHKQRSRQKARNSRQRRGGLGWRSRSKSTSRKCDQCATLPPRSVSHTRCRRCCPPPAPSKPGTRRAPRLAQFRRDEVGEVELAPPPGQPLELGLGRLASGGEVLLM